MDPLTILPLQSGPADPGFGQFVLLRLFGLVFAAVYLVVLLRPGVVASRRVRHADGSVVIVEPTGVQVFVSRGLAALFVVLGPVLFLYGPEVLSEFNLGF